jgi:uncharacterized protein YlxW (UPF0749 family)
VAERSSFPSRFVLAAVVGLVGFLVVTTTQSSPGPRLSRKARLVDLIQLQDERARELRRQLAALQAELEQLQGSAAGRGQEMAALAQQAEALAPAAGLGAVRGPGAVVELADSTLRESPTGDPNDLVVHEQDLQAIVNALWASGAEAIAVNGERITARSAIRCVGNTLLLHGSVYGPPYRIAAIGDPARLSAGLGRDDSVERFRVVAEEFRLRFDVSSPATIELPAFRGVALARFAEVTA